MSRLVIVAFLFVVAVGSYYLVATRQREPGGVVALVPSEELPLAVESDAAMSDAASIVPPSRSAEQRSETIKDFMRMSMGVVRQRYIDELMAKGLARLDSERIVDEFTAGTADCLFEAARNDYEARGYTRDEFLHGAEMIWSSGSQVTDLKYLPPEAVSCVANVSQQAGLSLAVEARPRGEERTLTSAEVPAGEMNSDEMEVAIRSHIANHTEVALTDLSVHCEPRGCEILMKGQDIKIFGFEFDRFAEQNGFRHAMLYGDASFRTVYLQR